MKGPAVYLGENSKDMPARTRAVYSIQRPPGDVLANRVPFSAERSATGLYLLRLYSGIQLYFFRKYNYLT